jgi:hypothetical protein
MTSSSPLTIRLARPDDDAALARLAALDSQRPLTGDALVAEAGGRLRAALALDGGRVLADPFERTADDVAMLRLRADRLEVGPRVNRPRRRHAVPALR